MSFMFRDLEEYGESPGNCWEVDDERMTWRRHGGRAAPRFPRFRRASGWAGAAPSSGGLAQRPSNRTGTSFLRRQLCYSCTRGFDVPPPG